MTILAQPSVDNLIELYERNVKVSTEHMLTAAKLDTNTSEYVSDGTKKLRSDIVSQCTSILECLKLVKVVINHHKKDNSDLSESELIKNLTEYYSKE